MSMTTLFVLLLLLLLLTTLFATVTTRLFRRSFARLRRQLFQILLGAHRAMSQFRKHLTTTTSTT